MLSLLRIFSLFYISFFLDVLRRVDQILLTVVGQSEARNKAPNTRALQLEYKGTSVVDTKTLN